jgi:hypothetical protein
MDIERRRFKTYDVMGFLGVLFQIGGVGFGRRLVK